MNIAVLIPAYRPTAALVPLVRELAGSGARAIVLVDDGSGAAFDGVFQEAAALPGVHLLRHEQNRGKGAALKTGIEFARRALPGLAGIVTADADGQHHPDDIRRVARALELRPEALVLGARGFAGAVPLRSRLGNTITRAVVHAVIGQKLADTQTGLRGIPAALLPHLLRIDANGYEFELEMLIAAHRLSIPLVEEPIRTIYQPGNPSSHFNPLLDSMKIYFVLLRFASVSLATALIDNLVFYLAYRRTGHILASQIMGRAVAVAFNYLMVRRSVFYSHQRHLAVLPQYLMLVAASGALSYGGIRLLSDHAVMSPVAAKLLVETLLFFGNFAVQRLIIFRPEGAAASHERSGRATSLLVLAVLTAVVAAEIYGFSTSHLFAQEVWTQPGMRRFLRYTGLFLEIGIPLLLMAPWTFTGAVCALMLAGTALAAPMGLLATLYFLLSSWALGSRIFRHAGVALATMAGLAIYILLMGAVARAPLNYPAVWAIVLAIPILLSRARVLQLVKNGVSLIRRASLPSPRERAAFALLIFVLGMHWLVVLKPDTGADALAMHLAVPANIAAHHRMTYTPDRYLWSVMPMGADWAYSITYLMGGESAARLFNFAMLLALLVMLYQAVRRWVSSSLAFLLLALFAATPMVQYVTGSLFVENFLAALLFATVAALWQFSESGERRFLYLSAALCGAALATKVGAFAFLLLLLPFAIVEARRQRVRAGAALLAIVILLALALPTYVIAWSKTGNPIFPFFNTQIPSRVLDPAVVIRDFRFRQPLTWSTPYDLTFRTHQFFEGQNGSFGFQYLLMLPLALAALLVSRKRPVAMAAIVGLGAIAIVLRTEPNARYLYAGLPLLFVPFAALLAWLESNHRALFRATLLYLLACLALNVYFLPASSWYNKDFYSQLVFLPHGRERLLHADFPLRDLVQHFTRTHPGKSVLFLNDIDLADVTADAYLNNWHQYHAWERIQNAANRLDMLNLLARWNVEYIIGASPPPGTLVQPRGLRELLDNCVQPEYENSWFYLVRLEPKCEDESHAALWELPLLEPGRYDDFDVRLRFRGDWERTEEFAQPSNHTISFSDVPGANASIAFKGRALTWFFTKAPNRGLAEFLIDGDVKATLDLYSAKPEWQSLFRYCCLAPGRHVASVRVLGKQRPGATGHFIDVDAFLVE